MLDVLGEDYVRTARAKGLAERAVVWRHALRNALIPTVTVVGLQFGYMLGGAVLGAVIVVHWIQRGFGAISEERAAIAAATLLIIGIQVFFSSFLLSILGLRRR